MADNIYPIYDMMMTREDKEHLLRQRGMMVWFTGLSGSGKSTIAMGVERELHARGILCRILDGDNIREEGYIQICNQIIDREHPPDSGNR